MSSRGVVGSLTRPHSAGLEDGPRLVSAIAGTLLLGAAVLHVSAAGDHTNLPVMMAGFLVVGALQGALGGLLLFRRAGRLLVGVGVALTLGTLATWLVSRTSGLPFLPGGHMEPIGFKDGVTVLFETATLPLLALLASAEIDRVRLPSPRLGSQALAVIGTGVFALFVPALVLGGGEHHSAAEMAHGHDDAGDDAHGHDGLLADATGGHFGDAGHAGGSDAGHAGGHHAAEEGGAAGSGGPHDHGRRASAAVFADAHPNAGAAGHHGAAEHPDEAGAGRGHAHGDGAGPSGGSTSGGGHTHGRADHGGGSPEGGTGERRGSDRGDGHSGGGHRHGSGEVRGGHGGDGHADGGHAASAGPGDGQRAIALESGHGGGGGGRPRGPAIVAYDRPDESMNGAGHAHDAGPCQPTAAQRAAADRIVAEVRAELRQYENNPAAALADGFDYVFGPTDRMLHVVHLERVADPDVLEAGEIESFIYYMTDTGFVPIGGMFIMPEYGVSGPEPGGCLTKWHYHGGLIGRWATAGTSATTPAMMHVFTYPGLDPWGHYNGRDLAPLWTPGAWVPSVCRSSGDANDGCLP